MTPANQMNYHMGKVVLLSILAVSTLSVFFTVASVAEQIREASFGDFPGSGGAFKNIGTLSGPTTTIEGSLMFDSDIYDVIVFRTTGTTNQITVRPTTGRGGDFAINLGTGTAPQFVNLGGMPDLFRNPKIVVPGEYPLLSEPLAPGTYYLGLRTAIFQGVIDYEIEIEQAGGGTPPCFDDPSISRSENGAFQVSYGIRPGWVHQLEESRDLRSGWSPLGGEIVGDWRTEMQTINSGAASSYFRLRRRPEMPELFPGANISAEVGAYTSGTWANTAIALCEKRYPDAAWFIEQDQQGSRWFEVFAPASSDLQQTAALMASAIHETVHGASMGGGGGTDQRLVFGEDKFLDVPGEPAPMPRSAIVPHLPQASLDTQYDEIFLDENFGGRGGFVSVLEELNAFTIGHLVDLSFRDTFPVPEGNQRQGVLTFMLYLELYLQTARLEQSEKYQKILKSPRMVNAALVVWGRAEAALERSFEDLETSDLDMELNSLVRNPEFFAEIERLADSVIPCR